MPSRLARLLRLLALLVMIDLAASAAWLGLSYTVPEPEAGPADAIAVLWGNGHRLGPETIQRLDHAEQLWRDGRAGRLALIGGARPMRGFSGAAVMANQLLAAGLPRSALVFGDGSNDTRSNVAELEQVAERHGFRRVLVVTDRLQALRISLLYPRTDRLLAPYPYRWDHIRPLHLWWRIHREWASFAGLLLPDRLRDHLLERFRG
jgi:uncharacterized SAM-binding protein YcdF (DUF218 family)